MTGDAVREILAVERDRAKAHQLAERYLDQRDQYMRERDAAREQVAGLKRERSEIFEAAEADAERLNGLLREHANEIEALRAQLAETQAEVIVLTTERDGARKIAEALERDSVTEHGDDIEGACPPWLTVEAFCANYDLPLPEGFVEDEVDDFMRDLGAMHDFGEDSNCSKCGAYGPDESLSSCPVEDEVERARR